MNPKSDGTFIQYAAASVGSACIPALFAAALSFQGLNAQAFSLVLSDEIVTSFEVRDDFFWTDAELRSTVFLTSSPPFAVDFTNPQSFEFILTPESPGSFLVTPWESSDYSSLRFSLNAVAGGGGTLIPSDISVEFLNAENEVVRSSTTTGLYGAPPNGLGFSVADSVSDPFSFSSIRVSATFGDAYHNDSPVAGMDSSLSWSLLEPAITVYSMKSNYLGPETFSGTAPLRFTPVPEPAASGFILGLAAIAAIGLRRRARGQAR
jgi:hypothetical protein